MHEKGERRMANRMVYSLSAAPPLAQFRASFEKEALPFAGLATTYSPRS